jgi:hypothetical protein
MTFAFILQVFSEWNTSIFGTPGATARQAIQRGQQMRTTATRLPTPADSFFFTPGDPAPFEPVSMRLHNGCCPPQGASGA